MFATCSATCGRCSANWEILGAQLRFEASTIIHVVNERRSVSPTMAFRVARLAKVSIDGLLSGRFRPPANVCVNCGHKHGGRR